MNKSKFVEALAERVDLSKTKAADVVGAIFDPNNGILAQAMQDSESVSIAGFGKFESRQRKARKGRNPHTGQEMKIPAKRVPAFSASSKLKEGVGGS